MSIICASQNGNLFDVGVKIKRFETPTTVYSMHLYTHSSNLVMNECRINSILPEEDVFFTITTHVNFHQSIVQRRAIQQYNNLFHWKKTRHDQISCTISTADCDDGFTPPKIMGKQNNPQKLKDFSGFP